MDSIKKDIMRMKNGEEDDLAEIRRMIKEVDSKMNTHCPANVAFNGKLKGLG